MQPASALAARSESAVWRVQFPRNQPDLAPRVRDHVEREVTRVAQETWRQRASLAPEQVGISRGVDIHVENVAVKIEGPPAPVAAAAPAAPAVSPGSAASEGFAAFYLRRTCSGI